MMGELTGHFRLLQAGGSTGLLMDLAANEKAVHPDFFNGDRFEEKVSTK
uniref:COP9 signalosome complex subunit 9 n=1 Tax=Scleropages formosus TaxID=113540 RepID=A0A8C9RG12_SCLFO